MVAKDAQTWLNSNYKNKNTVTEILAKTPSSGLMTPFLNPSETLNGGLIIEDFPNLKNLELEDVKELDKLVIKNCPKLEEINIQNSGVKELKLDPSLNSLLFLDFSFDIDGSAGRPTARKIDKLDLSNVPNLKVLKCFGEQETKLTGIEKLTQLQSFNSGETLNDKTIVSLPTKIFRDWKESIKKVLGIITDDLPDTWQTDLVTKLGGKNLTQLPSGKNLKDLIDDFSTDKDDLQKKLDQVQKELDKRKDYEEIKQERDQLSQQCAEIRKELNLDQDATKEKVLGRIKELIKNVPPVCSHTDYETIKSQRDSLKTEIETKKRKISELESENKENVITKKVLVEKTDSILKELNISTSSEIGSAGSALEVEQMRSEKIKNEFSRLKDENNSSFYLNIGLGALTISSLIFLSWMAMKQTNLPETEKEK